jgi:hypothetical protein
MIGYFADHILHKNSSKIVKTPVTFILKLTCDSVNMWQMKRHIFSGLLRPLSQHTVNVNPKHEKANLACLLSAAWRPIRVVNSYQRHQTSSETMVISL